MTNHLETLIYTSIYLSTFRDRVMHVYELNLLLLAVQWRFHNVCQNYGIMHLCRSHPWAWVVSVNKKWNSLRTAHNCIRLLTNGHFQRIRKQIHLETQLKIVWLIDVFQFGLPSHNFVLLNNLMSDFTNLKLLHSLTCIQNASVRKSGGRVMSCFRKARFYFFLSHTDIKPL